MKFEKKYTETKLSVWLEQHRPAEFHRNREAATQSLRRQCEAGRVNSIKRGKLWYIIGDGHTYDFTDHRSNNPIFGSR